jgi:uncharacterized protein YndB with AHSA1/START domain
MKSTFETVINAPIEATAKTLANPANNIKWMKGLESYEHLSGAPGRPGAISRLVMNDGRRKMVFTGKVVSVNLPHSLVLTLDAPNVLVTASANFTKLSPRRTRYVSAQTFEFKGIFNKLFGFFAGPVIRKQQHKDMMYFKEFMEQQ